MTTAPPNGVPLAQRPRPGATERRMLAVDIPAGADDELAAMAMLVATLEALPAEDRRRVIGWAYDRYSRLRVLDDLGPGR